MLEQNRNYPIEARPVPAPQRPEFLPRHLGAAAPGLAAAHALMMAMAGDYRGGFWEFYELSNGGFYMAPVDAPRWRMVIADGAFDAVLSSDAAGIIVTMATLMQMVVAVPGNAAASRAAAECRRLAGFANYVPEAPLIHAAFRA